MWKSGGVGVIPNPRQYYGGQLDVQSYRRIIFVNFLLTIVEPLLRLRYMGMNFLSDVHKMIVKRTLWMTANVKFLLKWYNPRSTL